MLKLLHKDKFVLLDNGLKLCNLGSLKSIMVRRDFCLKMDIRGLNESTRCSLQESKVFLEDYGSMRHRCSEETLNQNAFKEGINVRFILCGLRLNWLI